MIKKQHFHSCDWYIYQIDWLKIKHQNVPTSTYNSSCLSHPFEKRIASSPPQIYISENAQKRNQHSLIPNVQLKMPYQSHSEKNIPL